MMPAGGRQDKMTGGVQRSAVGDGSLVSQTPPGIVGTIRPSFASAQSPILIHSSQPNGTHGAAWLVVCRECVTSQRQYPRVPRRLRSNYGPPVLASSERPLRSPDSTTNPTASEYLGE